MNVTRAREDQLGCSASECDEEENEPRTRYGTTWATDLIWSDSNTRQTPTGFELNTMFI